MELELIRTTLTGLLEKLNLSFENIEVSEAEGFTRVDIVSNQPSKIIGWHGETLNSIQHLLKSIIRSKKQMERSPFIVLDVDNYRRSQEEKVCATAKRKADFVRRTGNRVALPPMSPYFRRVVHLFVANDPDLADLTTASTGEGDYRQIVLRLKEEKGGQQNADDEGELSPVMAAEDSSFDNLDI